MLRTRSQPPEDGNLPHLPLVRVPTRTAWKLAITCTQMLQVDTHYMNRRTLPCVTHDCPGCAAELPRRYEAYISALTTQPSRHVIVALTPKAAQPAVAKRPKSPRPTRCHRHAPAHGQPRKRPTQLQIRALRSHRAQAPADPGISRPHATHLGTQRSASSEQITPTTRRPRRTPRNGPTPTMAHDFGKKDRWLGMYITGDIGPLTFYTSQRAKLVVFPRAPPLNPPSATQETIRELFRTYAASWRALTNAQRQQWLTIARKANLAITGYNLFFWFCRSRDEAELRTLERQTGITLTRP